MRRLRHQRKLHVLILSVDAITERPSANSCSVSHIDCVDDLTVLRESKSILRQNRPNFHK